MSKADFQTHPNLASQINLNLLAFKEICFLDGKYIILYYGNRKSPNCHELTMSIMSGTSFRTAQLQFRFQPLPGCEPVQPL